MHSITRLTGQSRSAGTPLACLALPLRIPVRPGILTPPSSIDARGSMGARSASEGAGRDIPRGARESRAGIASTWHCPLAGVAYRDTLALQGILRPAPSL